MDGRGGCSIVGNGALAAGLVAMALLSGPSARAQTLAAGNQRAFAAADAHTQTQQVCVEDALDGARACALAKCKSSGGRDCRITASCQPSQWAGNLEVVLQGSRLALAICGVPSRPGLIARMKDICRGYRSRGLNTCTLETVWTPSGEPETANLRWTRQNLGQVRVIRR